MNALASRLVPLAVLAAASQPAPAVENPDDEVTAAACREKLARLWEPIASYRERHGELPNRLSELLEEGLVADSTLFLCPRTIQEGLEPERGGLFYPDPVVDGAYHYEFNLRTLAPPEMRSGVDVTMREWKMRQRELLGAEVPLVRCGLHPGRYLNLGVEGDVFDGALEWEDAYEPGLRAKLGMRSYLRVDFRESELDEEIMREWVGREAPPLDVRLLDGERFRLADERGRVVLLTFWHSDCLPCIRVLPGLEEIAARYGDGIRVVTVNLRDDPETAEALLDRIEVTLPVAVERDGQVAPRYRVASVPRTLVIDRDGRVTACVSGRPFVFGSVVKKALDRALAAR